MLRWLLYPLALLYRIATSFRNFLYNNSFIKSVAFNIPIICVGNITVGGTGKTPHIEYLVKILINKYKIATLSRGYKRKTSGYVLADTESSSSEIGDEPRQLKQKFPSLNVAVCEKRVVGVKKILNQIENIEVILLDDGFQHRQIKPGLSIVLVDYHRPIYDDVHLPVGRLRESAYNHTRANIIIVTKCPPDLKPIDRRIFAKNLGLFPFQSVYFTTVNYCTIQPVFTQKFNQINEIVCKENQFPILIVTGIANANGLIDYVKNNLSKQIHILTFSDHHNFTQNNIKKIEDAFDKIIHKNKIILTTEKDAMRFVEIKSLPENIKTNIYCLPIEIEFLFDEKDIFEKQIIQFLTNDQSFHKLKMRGKKL